MPGFCSLAPESHKLPPIKCPRWTETACKGGCLAKANQMNEMQCNVKIFLSKRLYELTPGVTPSWSFSTCHLSKLRLLKAFLHVKNLSVSVAVMFPFKHHKCRISSVLGMEEDVGGRGRTGGRDALRRPWELYYHNTQSPFTVSNTSPGPFTMPRPAIKLLILKAGTKGTLRGYNLWSFLKWALRHCCCWWGRELSSLEVRKRKKNFAETHLSFQWVFLFVFLNCSSRGKTHVASGKWLIKHL